MIHLSIRSAGIHRLEIDPKALTEKELYESSPILLRALSQQKQAHKSGRKVKV